MLIICYSIQIDSGPDPFFKFTILTTRNSLFRCSPAIPLSINRGEIKHEGHLGKSQIVRKVLGVFRVREGVLAHVWLGAGRVGGASEAPRRRERRC